MTKEYKLSTYKRSDSSVISDKATWERPFTAKRYIHPPLCERIITMWPSFMIMSGEIRGEYESYMNCMCDIMDDLAKTDIKDNEFLITNRLGYEPVDPQVGAIGNSAINLIRAKVIKPQSKYARLVENYYRNRGYGQKGLMGLMSDGLIIQGHNADMWAEHLQ